MESKKAFFSDKTKTPELANIGRKMALGFSTFVLVLMLIIAITGSLFYSRINNNSQRELEQTITELLAHSINRISFSGKYHARLLVEQITSSQPNIAFITIIDKNGNVIAQSAENFDIRTDISSYESTMASVLNHHSTVFNNGEYNSIPIREVAMPYRSGYKNKINGVIFVGISEEHAKYSELRTHWAIALIIFLLSIISLLVTYLLSKHYAAPAISQAWQFKRILEAAPLLLFITDKSGEIKNSSSLFSSLPRNDAETIETVLSSASKNNNTEQEIDCSINGKAHTFLATRFPVLNDSHGNPSLMCSIAMDITVRKETEAQLTFNATHDMLTGLTNRREFENRVTLLLAENTQEQAQHALCYMDLDQFKVVNDTSGHVAGDELLKQLSKILHQKVRRNDTLARLGGDEFGVLLENCSLDDAHRLAETLLNTVNEFQFAWENIIHRVGVSIGLVSISNNSHNLTELLKEADAACYLAKDLGRNRIHTYQRNDTQISERQGEMLWVNRIQHALTSDKFCLVAQEILSLDKEHSSHYELLIRMIDEQGSQIPPGAFLPAAERFDLITNIDYWVVEAAFKLLSNNPNFLSSVTFISINLSGPSLTTKDFHSFVANKLSQYHIPAQKICFEITETAAITNLQSATQFITAMKQLGCQFALDDFGSGLSSFGYLKQLPVEYLKIDGMFVKDIESDPIDLAMVESINQIGQVMGMKTIAEFVENDEIKTILTKLGVNYAQGYGVGKPIPLEQLLAPKDGL